MATIQLGTTKNINSLLSYCEKKSDITKGIDCSEQTAKQQMRATRELFNKTIRFKVITLYRALSHKRLLLRKQMRLVKS